LAIHSSFFLELQWGIMFMSSNVELNLCISSFDCGKTKLVELSLSCSPMIVEKALQMYFHCQRCVLWNYLGSVMMD